MAFEVSTVMLVEHLDMLEVYETTCLANIFTWCMPLAISLSFLGQRTGSQSLFQSLVLRRIWIFFFTDLIFMLYSALIL